MRKSEDDSLGEQYSIDDKQCRAVMQMYGGYIPFEYKAKVVQEHLSQMPLEKYEKELVQKWIKQQHSHYVDFAFDYALQVKNGQQQTLKGKLSLYRLNKSLKAFVKDSQLKEKKTQTDLVLEL